MNISISDLKIIAANGGGMILDAATISANDLKIIASNASRGGGYITLRKVHYLSAEDLKIIASNGKGHIILDLT